MSETVYLLPADFDSPPPPFRTGAGGHFWLAAEGDFAHDTRVLLSGNTAHALLGHGVVDELNSLALMGKLGSGREVVVPQAELVAAAGILYEADRTTYGPGSDWDFEVGRDEAGRCCRLRIDNREYQRGLLRLTDLLNAASRVGHAAWLRI